MSDDVQFVCSACGIDSDKEHDNVMTACRRCGKLHCNDCVDEFGRCITCRETDNQRAD